jgi:glutamate dehydrogenase (NAD(P)+)
MRKQISMLDMELSDFGERLRAEAGCLGLWNDGKRLLASSSTFQRFADHVHGLPDFREHQAAFFQVGETSGQLHSVFLHRTARGPGAGGVRRQAYPRMLGLVTDGLRLAVGMGYKNALAGLWWGGGKGVIGCRLQAPDLDTVYEEFGLFISSLNGCYVTAEDVGTKPHNMATVFSKTRFTTCIPPRFGGSGNPSPATARGVFRGIEAALKFLELGDWSYRTVAIQGLGEVGFRLASLLHQAGATLRVFDPDPAKMQETLALDARHQASTNDGILSEEVDVLAPCALGAVLNPETIPKLRCKAICGAANNQLEDDTRDALSIHQRNVLFIPDFVVNRMGIVNCADEQYGRLHPDPTIERHLGWEWEQAIGPVVLRLLERARKASQPPVFEANSIAQELIREEHPMWPGRAKEIAYQSWQRIRERASS